MNNRDYGMGLIANRLATFKKEKWIHQENTPCSPIEMAKAGFTAVSRDCAVCHYCRKELDNWEANDVPWEEHKAHNPECPLIKFYSSPPDRVLFIDSIKLERDYLLNQVMMEHKKTVAEIDQFKEAAMAALGSRGKRGKPKRRQ